jgi:phosphoglucosamine mutase
VIIGKDTRLSGYMMETALVAGFTSVGMDVIMTGPLPTPAIALLAREMRADLGVMISASHNPYHDNGIKLFGPDGFKLSDADEEAIERLMESEIPLAQDRDVGRARRIDDARGRYIHAIKQSLPHDIRFDSLKVVVDCAHGAAYEVAPTAIWELGAKVISVGVSPNGLNINDGVGSTALDAIKARVVEEGADIGLALDGDADRLIVIDEKGQAVDGDQIMALIAARLAAQGELRGGGVVATVMSNLGLERFLNYARARPRARPRSATATCSRRCARAATTRRRAVRAHDPARPRDHRRRLHRRAAGARRAGPFGQARERAAAPVRSRCRSCSRTWSSGRRPLATRRSRPAIAEARPRSTGRGRLVIRKSGTDPRSASWPKATDAAQVEKVVDDICAAVTGGA